MSFNTKTELQYLLDFIAINTFYQNEQVAWSDFMDWEITDAIEDFYGEEVAALLVVERKGAEIKIKMKNNTKENQEFLQQEGISIK